MSSYAGSDTKGLYSSALQLETSDGVAGAEFKLFQFYKLAAPDLPPVWDPLAREIESHSKMSFFGCRGLPGCVSYSAEMLCERFKIATFIRAIFRNCGVVFLNAICVKVRGFQMEVHAPRCALRRHVSGLRDDLPDVNHYSMRETRGHAEAGNS